jgi:PilZ domain
MPRRSQSPASAAPSPAERTQADALLAHVARVLAPARPSPGGLARTDWVVARLGRGAAPSAPAPAKASPAGGRRLACAGCGWRVDCLAADAGRFAAAGCPRCGRALGELPLPARPAVRRPKEKRRRSRRAPTGSVRVEVRRAFGGGGPDLAVALVDVCGEGLGVWLTEALFPGEALTVVITRPGGRPIAAEAVVRWCAPGGGVTHRAGLRLRRNLTRAQLAELSL